METKKVPTSYQVIDLVRAAIKTPYARVSDTAVANALGITRGAVYGYKSGKEFMGLGTLARAQEFMELPRAQLSEIIVNLNIEATRDPQARALWEVLREHWGAHSTDRNSETGTKAGALATLTGSAILAVLSMSPQPARAAISDAAAVSGSADARGLYIMLIQGCQNKGSRLSHAPPRA